MEQFLIPDNIEDGKFLATRTALQIFNPRAETRIWNPLSMVHVPFISYQYQLPSFIPNPLALFALDYEAATDIGNTGISKITTIQDESSQGGFNFGQQLVQDLIDEFNPLTTGNKTILQRLKSDPMKAYTVRNDNGEVVENTKYLYTNEDQYTEQFIGTSVINNQIRTDPN